MPPPPTAWKTVTYFVGNQIQPPKPRVLVFGITPNYVGIMAKHQWLAMQQVQEKFLFTSIDFGARDDYLFSSRKHRNTTIDAQTALQSHTSKPESRSPQFLFSKKQLQKKPLASSSRSRLIFFDLSARGAPLSLSVSFSISRFR